MPFSSLLTLLHDYRNKSAKPVEMTLAQAQEMAIAIENQQDTETPIVFPPHIILKPDSEDDDFLFITDIDFGNSIVEFHGRHLECTNMTAGKLLHIPDNVHTLTASLRVFLSDIPDIETEASNIAIYNTSASKVKADFANCVILQGMPNITLLECCDLHLHQLSADECPNFKPTAIQKMLLEEDVQEAPVQPVKSLLALAFIPRL